jgi:glyoxylase-like metal-dependent hydrolase (beta-lactamase superfamily II)/rhodanese-related sulfurtransferase
MIFRQLFDPTSSTYTYLLACQRTGEAVLIDAVYEMHERDDALIRELDLNLRYVLDTHVHADHVTGAWLMKDRRRAEIVLSRRFDAQNVDIAVDQGDVLAFGDAALEVRATPGHTGGCITYVSTDLSRAFTGDCLMIRGTGRTDFQAGSADQLWESIRNQIFSLPDDCLIYPGHDYLGRTVSSIGEERRHNPRIGGDARREDFVGYMDNLGLPHPKLIDIAVPANQASGKPKDPDALNKVTWGPVTKTFAGVPEIRPDWVARHLDELFVLDVRSEAEFGGELGHLRGAHLIPLDQLRTRLSEVPKDAKVVAVCQSGKRSAMATEILRKAGYETVANVAGGLIHWSRLALPHLLREG